MVDLPVMQPPVRDTLTSIGGVELSDASDRDRWRVWGGFEDVPPGCSRDLEVAGEGFVFSVAPGEWIVVGRRPAGDHVDLTHVRAMFELTGPSARFLMSHVCAIDLSDLMTPAGSAARTLVAGVATEIVRHDHDGYPGYVLLVSRSFAQSVWDRLIEVTERLG